MTPPFHQTFTFLDWHLDTSRHELRLNYEIETIGKVTEVLSFPQFSIIQANKKQINSACDLVHWMCGVSYYKSGLAKEIKFKFKQPSEQILNFIMKTWFHGLAELAFENKISLRERFKGVSTLLRPTLSSKRVLTPLKHSLVALGGGKDSLVTIEELKQQGKDIYLFMVGGSRLIKDVAEFIDLPLIQIKRKIDDKLIAYNKAGAINGHVPITSINSAIAVLTALLFDCQEVVFSNEKSADSENTLNAEGDKVNHQYSKSHEFEKDFSAIIYNEITQGMHYYSQQRQFSELEILEKFSHYPQYFPVFSSCNRNFHIDGSHNNNSLWCCDCPKCRFVFLGLAPFIDKSELLKIFGQNLLDNDAQQKGFAELLGYEGIKPFECVGEIHESRQAFDLIKHKSNWKSDKLVQFFKQETSVNLANIRSKKIAVWGFGVEGRAVAKYLHKHAIDFTVLCSEKEQDDSYRCETKKVDFALLDLYDVVVKSPGISPYSDLVKNSRTQFTSATALWFANEKSTQVIAITGTKGKSTSVSLLSHVLESLGSKVNLVGNIGTPLIAVSTDCNYIVLEASSFQIYDGEIQADIALINNLYPEHIDWHDGTDNYFSDKLKLFNKATTKIINANNKELVKRTNEMNCVFFNVKNAFHVVGESLYLNNTEILKIDDIQLIGQHNLENIGAVLTICKELQLDIVPCIEAIKSFKPLEHRLQFLGKIGQYFAINDSIATTPIATLAALQTQDCSTTTLFVGGFDRGNEWSEFAQALNDCPPALLLLTGQSGKIIFEYLNEINSSIAFNYFEKLTDAIKFAVENTPKNHTLLLSPGAPSFDEFDNYKQRGQYFEKELRSK
jgi:UDP-N-acetylmuramoylalanine--D-glutamate ligase